MAKDMKKNVVKSTKNVSSAPKGALKMVYFFDEGKKEMKELLGGKGANLAEMTSLGVPVPAGFTITTETCDQYYVQGKQFPKGLKEQYDY